MHREQREPGGPPYKWGPRSPTVSWFPSGCLLASRALKSVTGYTPQHLWGRGPQLLSRSKFKAAEIISSISFRWRPQLHALFLFQQDPRATRLGKNSNKAEDHQGDSRQEIRRMSAGSLDNFSCSLLYFFIKFLSPLPLTPVPALSPSTPTASPQDIVGGWIVSGSGSSLQALG